MWSIIWYLWSICVTLLCAKAWWLNQNITHGIITHMKHNLTSVALRFCSECSVFDLNLHATPLRFSTKIIVFDQNRKYCVHRELVKVGFYLKRSHLRQQIVRYFTKTHYIVRNGNVLDRNRLPPIICWREWALFVIVLQQRREVLHFAADIPLLSYPAAISRRLELLVLRTFDWWLFSIECFRHQRGQPQVGGCFSRFVTPRGRWRLAVVETGVADAIVLRHSVAQCVFANLFTTVPLV